MRVMVLGVNGQLGSYVSELYLSQGAEVYGLHRRNSTNNFERLNHIINHAWFKLICNDITDASGINRVMQDVKPDLIINTAAQSHVGESFKQPSTTMQITALGCLNVLEAMREHAPMAKMIQCSTSEMWGSNCDSDGFQRETTPFHPLSPYAVAKVAAHNMCSVYRESYGLHISCAMTFNFESPRRGETFVTRKVTKYVGELKKAIGCCKFNKGSYPKLKMGNLASERDWGYAGDVASAFELILNQDKPDDYIVSTQESHKISEFLSAAFGYIGQDWIDYVVVDPEFIRPNDLVYLRGSSEKIRRLGWKPSVTFNELVEMMVRADIEKASKKTCRCS